MGNRKKRFQVLFSLLLTFTFLIAATTSVAYAEESAPPVTITLKNVVIGDNAPADAVFSFHVTIFFAGGGTYGEEVELKANGTWSKTIDDSSPIDYVTISEIYGGGDGWTIADYSRNEENWSFIFTNEYDDGSVNPTPEPTPVPTATPEPTPVPTPDPTQTPDPTPDPTATPDPTVTPEPTPVQTPDPTTPPTTPDPTNPPAPTPKPKPTDQTTPKTGVESRTGQFLYLIAATSALSALFIALTSKKKKATDKK